MIVNKEYLDLKRKAKNGCLESLLDLADLYSQELYDSGRNDELYFNTLLELLERKQELRESRFSSCLIYYEVMYQFLNQGNEVSAKNHLHNLTWELVWDYSSEDLEPYIEKYQIREIARYLNVNIEEVINQVKAFQRNFDPTGYKVIGVNYFFTNT